MLIANAVYAVSIKEVNILCCFLFTGNYAICVLTDINQAATDFAKLQPIKLHKRQNKMFSQRFKTFVFQSLFFFWVVSSPSTICFDINSLYPLRTKIKDNAAARNLTHRHEAKKQTEIFFLRRMICYVWWCNGWMFVSSLSLIFPFSSTVFMFAVSSSHHFLCALQCGTRMYINTTLKQKLIIIFVCSYV